MIRIRRKTGVLCAGAWLLCGALCTGLPAAEDPEIRSVYTYTFQEPELLEHDNVILLSEMAVFTLHRAPRAKEYILCRTPDPEEDNSCLGTPSVVYVHAGRRVKAFAAGTIIPGELLKRPWLVMSYAGDPRAPVDVPVLFVFGRRPSAIDFTDARELKVRYDEPDTGWIAMMPLYGFFKPRQKGGPDWRRENGLPRKGPETWKWRRRFPKEVQKRVEWWTRVCRAFPVGYRETFSVDREHDTITTREDFTWLTVEDDWNTEPIRFAAVPPMVAFSRIVPGLPITFTGDGEPAEIQDPWYVTVYGPYMGIENVDRVEYTLPVGKYINYALELDPEKLTGETDRTALANIEKIMRGKFYRPDLWRFDHGGANIVWVLHGDQWYARALPLVSEELAARAREGWRIYMGHHAIEPRIHGWRSVRGRWILLGPGCGAWGSFGDGGKLGEAALPTVWAFARYADGWDVVREKWEFIKRMANTDLVSADWLHFCRSGHAEWGDIGPPDMALARMAYKLGDAVTGDYFSFLAMRQLVAHFGTFHAGTYFRENGPYRSHLPMPETVFASHLHIGPGWFVNGPPKKGQWVNRFVRFQCPDLGRFYQDTLDERMRRYLENPAVLGMMGGPLNQESHFTPSFLRLWALATTASREEILPKGPWENWTRSFSAQLAGNYAVLLTAKEAQRLVRVIDKAPASPFVPGQERHAYHHTLRAGLTGGWQGNVPFTNPWYGSRFGEDAEGNPVKRRSICFGYISPPDPGEGKTYFDGEQVLHWAGLARWADVVPSRDLDEERIAELERQFSSTWMVCGPFSIGTDDGLEQVYPPEQEIDLEAEYPSGIEDVKAAWQEADATEGKTRAGKTVPGWLDSQTLFGGIGRVGYHLQYIRSPAERRARLRVRHNGGCKVWLNDEQVFYRHYRHRAEEWSTPNVTLREGWNKLLVKTEGMWGRWITAAHVYAPDGRPFEDLEYSSTPQKPSGGRTSS